MDDILVFFRVGYRPMIKNALNGLLNNIDRSMEWTSWESGRWYLVCIELEVGNGIKRGVNKLEANRGISR